MRFIIIVTLLFNLVDSTNSRQHTLLKSKPKEISIKKDSVTRLITENRLLKSLIKENNFHPNQQVENKDSKILTSKFSLTEIVSISASFAAVVTSLFTFLLFRQNQKTLNLSLATVNREGRRLEAEMVSRVYRNFRETYSSMVNDKNGLKVLSEAHGTLQSEVKINMFGSFLINNVHEIYDLKAKGFIMDDVWDHYIIDIKEFFEFPFIVSRWEKIHNLYPKDFIKFVDNLLKNN